MSPFGAGCFEMLGWCQHYCLAILNRNRTESGWTAASGGKRVHSNRYELKSIGALKPHRVSMTLNIYASRWKLRSRYVSIWNIEEKLFGSSRTACAHIFTFAPLLRYTIQMSIHQNLTTFHYFLTPSLNALHLHASFLLPLLSTPAFAHSFLTLTLAPLEQFHQHTHARL